MQSTPSTLTDLLRTIPAFLGIRLDEPAFEVVTVLDGGVEIRRYARAVAAQISLTGDHDDAVGRGVRRLQSYLAGANEHRADLGSLAEVRREGFPGGWKVSVLLTAAVELDDLPRPYDREVRLVSVPETIVAALTYRGDESEADRDDARTRLLAALDAPVDYRIASHVHWASFDPRTLAFAKRNEARVDLDPATLPRSAANEAFASPWLASGLYGVW